MRLTVIDHRQQPRLNQTKKQPNNQSLTLATLLLNDIYYPEIEAHFSKTHLVQAIINGLSEFWKSVSQLAQP